MSKPIASDGFSSSYYDIPLPRWVVERIVERQGSGMSYIRTEELIESGFGNDFDFANAFKSLVRAWGASRGAGKAGNSVVYDLNKITYSINKIREREDRKDAS